MTPTKRTFRRTVALDQVQTATGTYTKVVTTPASGRLSAILYCVSGAIQWATVDKGGPAPVNLIMGQLSAGQPLELAAEDSQDIYVRTPNAGSFCFAELVQ